MSSVKAREIKNPKRYSAKEARIILDKEIGGKYLREGDRNREKIFRHIVKNKDKGVMLGEISKGIGLSRQATNGHLRVLLAEKRIYKNDKRKFFPTNSISNQIWVFAQQMTDARRDMINLIEPEIYQKEKINSIPKLKLYQYPGFKLFGFKLQGWQLVPDMRKIGPSPRDYLHKSLSEATLSEYFCKLNFNKSHRCEKYLFEFASRIGAYITYIFIQSLYHIGENNKFGNEERKKLTLSMIDWSIDIHEIFDSFLDNLSFLETLNIKGLDYTKIFELDKIDFNKISDAFRNIYPNLYTGFENYLYHPTIFWLEADERSAKQNGCNHEWMPSFIFKFGKVLHCNKCNNSIRDKDDK